MGKKGSAQAIYVTKPRVGESLANEIEGILKTKGFEEHPESGVFIGKSPEEAEHLLMGFASYFEKEGVLVVSEVFEIQKESGTEAVFLKTREIAASVAEQSGGQKVRTIKLDLPHFVIIKKNGNSVEYSLYRNRKDKNIESLKGAWGLVKSKLASTDKSSQRLIAHLKVRGRQRMARQAKTELNPGVFKTTLLKDT